MNLLCPNCQKMLTVPEQYAGQLMKCPLCSGTFTVPGLPSSGAGPVPEPPPFTPPPSSSPPTPPAPPPPPDVYTFRNEPDPMSAPPSLAPLTGPTGTSTSTTTGPTPGTSSPSFTPGTPAPSFTPSIPAGPPVGYTRALSIPFSDKVLQYVPPVAVVLIFILQLPFFSWVGLYPGGVWKMSQSAWGIAFDDYGADPDIGPGAGIKDKEERRKAQEREYPGASVPMIFYLLLGLANLVLTVACAAWGFIEGKVKLPPQVQQLLPYRWLIVTATNAVVFFFLLLPVLLGFPLEKKMKEEAYKEYDVSAAATTKDAKEMAAKRGYILNSVERTWALDLVVILHILAIVCAALVFWVQKRGPQYPPPKIELAW